jgi:hypothetical protein
MSGKLASHQPKLHDRTLWLARSRSQLACAMKWGTFEEPYWSGQSPPSRPLPFRVRAVTLSLCLPRRGIRPPVERMSEVTGKIRRTTPARQSQVHLSLYFRGGSVNRCIGGSCVRAPTRQATIPFARQTVRKADARGTGARKRCPFVGWHPAWQRVSSTPPASCRRRWPPARTLRLCTAAVPPSC